MVHYSGELHSSSTGNHNGGQRRDPDDLTDQELEELERNFVNRKRFHAF